MFRINWRLTFLYIGVTFPNIYYKIENYKHNTMLKPWQIAHFYTKYKLCKTNYFNILLNINIFQKPLSETQPYHFCMICLYVEYQLTFYIAKLSYFILLEVREELCSNTLAYFLNLNIYLIINFHINSLQLDFKWCVSLQHNVRIDI